MDENMIYTIWLDGFLAGQASKGMEPDVKSGDKTLVEINREVEKDRGRCPLCSGLQTEEHKPYCSKECEVLDNLL